MEKYDKFFLDKYPCSKTSMQGHLSRKNLSMAIFASVNYLLSALIKENFVVIFSIYTTKENFSGKTCQGELTSLYSQQVFRRRFDVRLTSLSRQK